MLPSTKRSLSGLAVALLLVGVVLVAAVRELTEWWSSQPSVADVGLPVAKSGSPSHETDVVLTVFHEAPAGSPCRDELCTLYGHWHAALSVRGEPLGTRTSLDEPWQSRSRRAWLREVADLKTPDPSGFSKSEATVAIRCPANAPYEVVAQIMTDVAASRLYRIEHAVTSVDGSVSALLSAPLPKDELRKGFLYPGVNVAIERSRSTRECSRVFDYRPLGFPLFEPSTPGELQTIAAGDAGDTQLETLVREARHRSVKMDVLIDARFDVPFQAVVSTIDALRAAGVEQIDFLALEPR